MQIFTKIIAAISALLFSIAGLNPSVMNFTEGKAIIPHRLNGKAREMAEGCMMLSGYSPDEVFSLVDVFLIRRYNGEKGRMNKWFFYLFYPVHLLILALICMAVKLY